MDTPCPLDPAAAVAWLAAYLKAKRNYALVVVTHDRWFLDRVATHILA